MKGFFAFLYICLSFLFIIGGTGYLFYFGEVLFGIVQLIVGALIALNFFEVIQLPTRKWLSGGK